LRRFGTLIFSAFADIDLSFRARLCPPRSFRACATGRTGLESPGIASYVTTFSICVPPIGGFGPIRTSHQSGVLNRANLRSAGECVVIEQDPNDDPLVGKIWATAQQVSCCSEPVEMEAAGTAFPTQGLFAATFDGTATATNASPDLSSAECRGQFRLFLDVNDDNPFEPGVAIPEINLDDLGGFLPGSALGPGPSLPLPQEVTLVAAYVRGEGDHATIVPPPYGVTEVEFNLSGTTAFRGVAMNWPPEGGDEPDFSFADGTQGPVTVLFDNDHLARIKLHVFDYGGITTVDAAPRNDLALAVLRLPKDENNNKLPDVGWPVKRGIGLSDDMGLVAEEDIDTLPSQPGDRLSNYEEYRGFMVMGQHVRTSPFSPNLFVAGNWPAGHQLMSTSGLSVDRVRGEFDPQEPEIVAGEHWIDFWHQNAAAGGPIPGASKEKQTRACWLFLHSMGLDAVNPSNLGRTTPRNGVPNDGLAKTPDFTLVSRVFLEMHENLGRSLGLSGADLQAFVNEEVVRTGAHELGHCISIEHRPPELARGVTWAEVGTDESVMSTLPIISLPTGYQGNPLTFNTNDFNQIELWTMP